MKTANRYLLEQEDMTNPEIVPKWVIEEYKNFHQTVTDKTFPCYFGMSAEKRVSFVTHMLARTIGPTCRALSKNSWNCSMRRNWSGTDCLYLWSRKLKRSPFLTIESISGTCFNICMKRIMFPGLRINPSIPITICGTSRLQESHSLCLETHLPTNKEKRGILETALCWDFSPDVSLKGWKERQRRNHVPGKGKGTGREMGQPANTSQYQPLRRSWTQRMEAIFYRRRCQTHWRQVSFSS